MNDRLKKYTFRKLYLTSGPFTFWGEKKVVSTIIMLFKSFLVAERLLTGHTPEKGGRASHSNSQFFTSSPKPSGVYHQKGKFLFISSPLEQES